MKFKKKRRRRIWRGKSKLVHKFEQFCGVVCVVLWSFVVVFAVVFVVVCGRFCGHLRSFAVVFVVVCGR